VFTTQYANTFVNLGSVKNDNTLGKGFTFTADADIVVNVSFFTSTQNANCRAAIALNNPSTSTPADDSSFVIGWAEEQTNNEHYVTASASIVLAATDVLTFYSFSSNVGNASTLTITARPV
jgi:hypothetical protein